MTSGGVGSAPENPEAAAAPIGSPWNVTISLLLQAFGGGLVAYHFTAGATKDQGDHQNLVVAIGALAYGLGALIWYAAGKRSRRPARLLMLAAGLGGVVLAVLAARGLSALFVNQPLYKRQLSAIVIGLPASQDETLKGDYITGSLSLQRPQGRSAMIFIAWLTARGNGVEAFEEALSGVMKVTDPDFQRRGSLDVPVGDKLASYTRELVVRGRSSLTTGFVCGSRQFLVSCMDEGTSCERLQRKILATVQCQPDPAREPPAPAR